ncbi:helix-turn-helix domain-containing protein, partial [candidate division WWE3 bacterium]|nr:helix-turn-helix domain-containing protein [candidate division WWE3 bacterium]
MPAQATNILNTNRLGHKSLSVSEAAKILKVSPSTLRKLEREGLINAHRLPNGYRSFELAEILLYKESHDSNVNIETAYSNLEATTQTPINTFYKQPKQSPIFKYALVLLLSILAFGQKYIAPYIVSSEIIKIASIEEIKKNAASVLGTRDRNAEWIININNKTTINDTLFVKDLATLEGGLITNEISLTSQASLSGLLLIDDTTETTLEETLDIQGEVTSIGMNNTVINDGVIDGANLASAVDYSGVLTLNGGFILNVPLEIKNGISLEGDTGNKGDILTSNGDGTPIWTKQSEINAGKLNGISASQFLRSNTSDEYTSGTLAFSNGTLLDLSLIDHSNEDTQGLILPNVDDSPNNPSSGEGYLAWDTTNNELVVYNGSSWTNVSSANATITLQAAYEGGNTILLSAAQGNLEISNSSGSQFLIEESTGYIGINNATPGYNLDIGGTLNTQTLYINDVNVSATATELSLLSGRSGTILDSNNISSFATTGVTAGAGLTGGGTTGILNLQVGAGSGIVVNTDDIAIKLATSASTNSTSSFSGLEVDADGIRLLSGCTNTQVLAWNGSAWACTTIGGISSVSGSGEIGQVTFWDSSSTLTGEDEFFYDTST